MATTLGRTVTLAGHATIQDANTLTLNAANAITATDKNLTLEGQRRHRQRTITTGAGTLTKNDAGRGR